MLKVPVYSSKGNKLEDFSLPKVYDKEVNMNLLSQALRVFEVSSHFGLRKTKTRSEVVKTKKKLYKQKGTGGARHGSKNAPIFVGGGIAHGPRPVKRTLSLPQNMRNIAKNMAIALKVQKKEIIVLDGVEKFAKTKDVAAFLEKIAKEMEFNRFAFAVSDANLASQKFIRNLANSEVFNFRSLNTFNILKGGILVLDKSVFAEEKKEKKVEAKVVKEVKTAKKEVKKTVKKAVKKTK